MKTRKELKSAYKEMKFPMGVFQLRNLASGKFFVGSSTNLEAIWNRYRFQLNMGSHRNALLQKDWKEYGEEGFRFEVLEEIEFENELDLDHHKELAALEEMYLEELQPFGDRGYNKEKRRS